MVRLAQSALRLLKGLGYQVVSVAEPLDLTGNRVGRARDELDKFEEGVPENL